MKNNNITRLISILFLIFAISGISRLVYSQEEEEECGSVVKRYEWFYKQRAYPYDTIPANAFKNAIVQRDALISNNGYEQQGPNSGWVTLGPQPYGGIGSIASGRVKQTIYDPRDPNGNTAYVTGSNGGIWKTTDAGTTWLNKSSNLPILSSQAIELDAAHGILYYGTGEQVYYLAEYGGVGLFKSTDDGASWTNIWGDDPSQRTSVIFKITIAPNDLTGNTIYIAEGTGLYRTTNGGSTWTKLLPISGNRVCTDVVTSLSGAIVYAVGYSDQFWPGMCQGIGLYTSHDYGASFQPVDPSSGFPHNSGIPNEEYQYGRSRLSTSASSENTVYILTYDQGSGGLTYVYKSDNGGVGFYITNGGNAIYQMGGNTDFNMMLKCSPYNANICFVGLQDLLRTDNGGQSWNCKGGYCTWLPHPDFHALDFCGNSNFPNRIMTGCDGGVYSSENLGENWSDLNNNLGFAQLWDVSSNAYDVNSISGGVEDEGFGHKYTGGGPLYWSNDGSCDGGLVLSSPFKSNWFIGNVGCSSTLCYSTDGSGFPGANNYLSGTTICNWVASAVNHPSVPGKLYTIRYGKQEEHGGYFTPVHILTSTDYGVNWNGGSDFSFDNNAQLYNTPTSLAISQSNPNMMILVLNGNYWNQSLSYSQLIKLVTTDDGQTWSHDLLLQAGYPSDVPLRTFSHVEIDPVNPDEMYLTLSGYNTGHVFKSTNGGVNWTDISYSLPNSPTNDLIIHYTGPSTKELIIAQDIGVWSTDAQNIQWRSFASNLPNCPIIKLDHNRLSGKLNCSAYGRGAWQVDLPGPIYVPDNLYVTDNVTLSKQIVICNGGNLFLGHSSVPIAPTLTFSQPSNVPSIIVGEGGKIYATSSNQVTLTSGSSWGGISFTYGSSGSLNNCAFQNSDIPIQISYANPSDIGGGSMSPTNSISINGCTFQNGSIDINSTSTIGTFIENCTFSGSNSTTKTAIELNNSSSVYIYNNTINNSQNGISESAGNSEIHYNTINSGSVAGVWGINVDNSQTPWIRNNTITGFSCGVHLLNASPKFLFNTINTSTNGDTALFVGYASNPRLRPSYADDGTIIWDAGRNTIGSSTTLSANSIVVDNGVPDLNNGYNHLNAGNYYITGTLSSGITKYSITYNCWNGSTGDPTSKINLGSPRIYWSPATCDPPPGAFLYEENKSYEEAGGTNNLNEITNSAAPVLDPFPPYIIDKGFGHYDTIKVTSGSLNLPQDEILYSQAIKQEYLGNYSNAKNIYQQIVQDYHDSVTAVKALISMLPCIDNISTDTSRYTSLGNYYQSVIQNYVNDTLLRKTANELSHKTLIRRGHFPLAITNYESDIQSTNDSLEILCYQLNIVETYMLMQDHGDNSVQFTGRNLDLKPKNESDGFRKIYELLHRIKLQNKTGLIPKVFSLSQNYPNPFNPTTTIKYALPIATKVNIKIYDILGREVKTLVNEFKDAGFYEIKFDGTNIASGVYFYRIEAGKFVQSKKMVIIK